MSIYVYSDRVQATVDRVVHQAFFDVVRLSHKTSLTEDFAGIDLQYRTEHNLGIAVRVRHDRPSYAPDEDVTFATTEIPMILAGSYAPVALFLWLSKDEFVAGKIIDIYRMRQLVSPLSERTVRRNASGRPWITVEVDELFETRSLLKVGDGYGWGYVFTDSRRRLEEMMNPKGLGL